mgnify:CR=1 FL=1
MRNTSKRGRSNKGKGYVRLSKTFVNAVVNKAAKTVYVYGGSVFDGPKTGGFEDVGLGYSQPVREHLVHAVAKSLQETRYFSPIMLHMIASGESSGELDSMLARTAEQQEKSLESTVSGLVSIFEPVMLLVMGGVVAVIVAAIMLPILELQQMVQ